MTGLPCRALRLPYPWCALLNLDFNLDGGEEGGCAAALHQSTVCAACSCSKLKIESRFRWPLLVQRPIHIGTSLLRLSCLPAALSAAVPWWYGFWIGWKLHNVTLTIVDLVRVWSATMQFYHVHSMHLACLIGWMSYTDVREAEQPCPVVQGEGAGRGLQPHSRLGWGRLCTFYLCRPQVRPLTCPTLKTCQKEQCTSSEVTRCC